MHSFLINLLGCRNDNHAHMVANLAALKNFGCLCQVLQTTIGAGANNNLINLDVMAFLSRMGVFGQMGISNNGNQLVQLD